MLCAVKFLLIWSNLKFPWAWFLFTMLPFPICNYMDCPIEKFKSNNVILHQLIIMKKGDGPLTSLYNKKKTKQDKNGRHLNWELMYFPRLCPVSGARHVTLEANSHRR